MNNLLRQFQRSRQASNPKAKSNAPEKRERVATAQRIVEELAPKTETPGECSNPDCPHRAEIMAERQRQKDKAAKWRATRKGGA